MDRVVWKVYLSIDQKSVCSVRTALICDSYIDTITTLGLVKYYVLEVQIKKEII